MIPTLLSWSGGKDAAWALHALRQRGEFDVVGLLTTLTEGFDRISMQGIRRESTGGGPAGDRSLDPAGGR